MNPILSLIIPVYKVEAYVGACLDSILTALEQVEADELFEVICIDDGSPDRCGEILESYRTRFAALPRADRVHYTVIHQSNAGVSVARNAGLEVATGEWILFVDSDDAIAPFSLSYLVRALREHPVDILRFEWQTVSSQTAPFASAEQAIRVHDLTTDDGVRSAVRHHLLDPYVWNTCYRRSVIGSKRFLEDILVGEDCLFSTQVIVQSSSYAETETILYNYLKRMNSCLGTMDAQKHMYRLKTAALRLEVIHDWRFAQTALSVSFKPIRDALCENYAYISGRPRQEIEEFMPRYYEMGVYAFEGHPFHQWIFRRQCRLLIFLLLNLPWRIRVWLLKIKVVRTIRDLVRGDKSVISL